MEVVLPMSGRPRPIAFGFASGPQVTNLVIDIFSRAYILKDILILKIFT